MKKQIKSLGQVKAILMNLCNLPKPCYQESKTNNQKEGARTMKPLTLISIRLCAVIIFLLTSLVAPGWGQVNNGAADPQNLITMDDPVDDAGKPDPALDVNAITCCGQNVQVTRAEDNKYWAVVLYKYPNGNKCYRIYRNLSNGSGSWYLWTEIPNESMTSMDADLPDIEVNSSNGKGYIFHVNEILGLRGEYSVKETRFSLINQNVYDVSWEAGRNSYPSNLSMTISATSGTRYYCWQESNTVKFRRSFSSTVYTVASGCSYMYPGNAIAYCKYNGHLHILYTTTSSDVMRLESKFLDGNNGSWYAPVCIRQHGILVWYTSGGIASQKDRYLLATLTRRTTFINDPSDVEYCFTNSLGVWQSVGGWYYSGVQRNPSCTANSSGYFSILYNEFNGGHKLVSKRTSIADLTNWVPGTVDANLVTYYNTCAVNSACMQAGSNPQHGGAFYTDPYNNPGVWFGWATGEVAAGGHSGGDDDPSRGLDEFNQHVANGQVSSVRVANAQEFALLGAAPNPFNPTTTISFTLANAGNAKLTVFDVSGRAVATLVDGYRGAGAHEVIFDGTGLASGVYVYALEAGTDHATGKMVLMK